MGRTPISHVVYGAQDVEATAERLRGGLGLEAIPGSRFEDLGLTDWFVPFEDQYIELLTVADEDTAVRTPFGRWVAERTATGDRLLAWALEAEGDVDGVGRRLGAAPDELSFVDRAGVHRGSRLAGAARAFAEPCFPFFIAWEQPADLRRALREASASVHHESGAQGIGWVEVAGEEAAMREWLGGADTDVRITAGEPDLLAVGLRTDSGDVVLRASA
jgi:hypothetical protein